MHAVQASSSDNTLGFGPGNGRSAPAMDNNLLTSMWVNTMPTIKAEPPVLGTANGGQGGIGNDRDPIMIQGPVCLLNGDMIDDVSCLLNENTTIMSAPTTPTDFTSPVGSPVSLDSGQLNFSTKNNSKIPGFPSSTAPITTSVPFLAWPDQPLLASTSAPTSPMSLPTSPFAPAMSDLTYPYLEQPTPRHHQKSGRKSSTNGKNGNHGAAGGKSAHNAVERKYRNNINDRIAELRDAVPALRHAKIKKDQNAHLAVNDDDSHEEDSDEPIFMDGVAVATKLNKGTILQKATEYIHHLRDTQNDLQNDIDTLLQMILTQTPNGAATIAQYRDHVSRRDSEHRQKLAHREMRKRQRRRKSSTRSSPSPEPSIPSMPLPPSIQEHQAYYMPSNASSQ
ncbi:helix-loop-helix DNA-binding domain-containing protein [Gongronella butleri]|nr:helix-loop-helix DNA-binding domain-containing protein [Gongronella butleri]